MTLADAILLANNSQECFKDQAVYTNAAKGTVIHKIDFPTAWYEATILEPVLQAVDIPLTFGLGCWMVEALGDPHCINTNIGFTSTGAPRSNEGKNDPNDVDTGCCQLKVGYLHPRPAPDLEHAQLFALEPRTAIPYFASIVAGNIEYAKHLIATQPSPEARYKDPFMVATAIYNEGRSGFLKDYYEPGVWLHHCVSVQDWERWYAEHLGLAPLYPLVTP